MPSALCKDPQHGRRGGQDVYKRQELCRREGVDFLLPVGGGSVIDSAKAIGYGLCYDGDVWDFYAKKAVPKACLLYTSTTAKVKNRPLERQTFQAFPSFFDPLKRRRPTVGRRRVKSSFAFHITRKADIFHTAHSRPRASCRHFPRSRWR